MSTSDEALADHVVPSFDVTRSIRAGLKHQQPQIVWFSGLSGAGKSTVANLLEQALVKKGHHTFILDGDCVRSGLNKDLGFTDSDRIENIRRVAEVAKLMADAGLIVIVAFISPFSKERQTAREIAGDVRFIEVYLNTPLEICETRDPKGLYSRARRGTLRNFTGIDSAFEVPDRADIVLEGAKYDAAELADQLHRFMIGEPR